MSCIEALKLDSYTAYSDLEMSSVLLKILSEKLDSAIVSSSLKILIKMTRYNSKEGIVILKDTRFQKVLSTVAGAPSAKAEYNLALLLLLQLTRAAVEHHQEDLLPLDDVFTHINSANSLSIVLILGILREVGRSKTLAEKYSDFFSLVVLKKAIVLVKEVTSYKEEFKKLEGINYGFLSYGVLDLPYGYIHTAVVQC